MSTTTTDTGYLTPFEAANYLGITQRHLRDLVYRRRVPHYKVGRLVRFSLADLDKWMASSRVEATR